MHIVACLLVVASTMHGSQARVRPTLNFPDRLHVGQDVTVVLAIALGVVVVLYGYRLLRSLTFACGFLLGALLSSFMLETALGTASWVAALAWVAFVVVGTAGGCIALALYPLGVLLVGALLAYVVMVSIPYCLYPREPNLTLDIAVPFLGGMLSWLLERPFTILATSFVGATSAFWGIGVFVGGYPSTTELEHFRSHELGSSTGVWLHAVPSVWWVYLAATLLFTLVGVIKQCLDTKKVRHYGNVGRYSGLRRSSSRCLP